MPAHLRPPKRHAARPLGALAVAVGIALLVVAGFSGRPADEGTTQLVQPAIESSTEPTVLSEELGQTTVPDAPPASAEGVTTTTGESSDGGGSVVTSPQLSPSPTIGPPVSVTRPPPRTTSTTTRPTTTTTTDPTTTTTEEPTTTTEQPTTTTDTTIP